ncbi:MAG: CPBP family intramembrane metalloprotease [Gammaproteobacteria bacterium]|nr:CPBP family intramembrane metalloprotease [Gammaproteobacteria bacterium]MCI0591508.1 CPBP family intramembrane metalloprotease [Gammaproteobacteria bacterium]
MKALGYFFCYVAVTIVIGALLSYALFLVIHDSPLAPSVLSQVPFHKVVPRAFMLVALLGLWPLLKSLGLTTRRDLGFDLPSRALLVAIGHGMIVGIMILASLAIVLVILGVRELDATGDLFPFNLVGVVIKALAAGILIALIEETVFRGAFYSVASKAFKVTGTIVFTALLYAAVHFIRSGTEIPFGDVSWQSGFTVLAYSLQTFWSLAFLDSFLALFSAGIFLGLVRFSTGHIGQCIGIHAGWVLSIKVTKYLTAKNDASDLDFLVGYYDGIIGYLAVAWLIIACLLYYLFSRRREAVASL